MHLDLDVLVVGRCCRSASYTNAAERCDHSMNLGLQSTAVERSKMADGCEHQMESLNSMKEMRIQNIKKRIPKSIDTSSLKSAI